MILGYKIELSCLQNCFDVNTVHSQCLAWTHVDLHRITEFEDD